MTGVPGVKLLRFGAHTISGFPTSTQNLRAAWFNQNASCNSRGEHTNDREVGVLDANRNIVSSSFATIAQVARRQIASFASERTGIDGKIIANVVRQ